MTVLLWTRFLILGLLGALAVALVWASAADRK